MILVLSAQAAPGVSQEEVTYRCATSHEDVLEILAGQSYDKVLLPWPPPEGLNPFSLSRELRRRNGPRLVLTGQLQDHVHFWAERNGCLLAESLEAALTKENDS